MKFNNRAMALAGIPDLPEEAFKHNGDRKIKPQGGGGGPTQSTSYQTNIPEYLEPYVKRMTESTENLIYKDDGFRPYKSYSEYDQARGGSGETVAGFTPMQSGAMRGLQGYQLPQQGQYGSMMAANAGLGAMNAGNQYAQQATNPYATQAYMSPYMEGAVAPQMREAARQSAMQGQMDQAKAVQQGAFGGGRSAIVEAERQRNLAQQQADIYGKGTQTAFEQARQAQQFGADLGLKGYGMGMEGGKTLADIGNQQYGQQMGLMGKQLEIGNQQQQFEQNRLNQVVQDYATSQQYPFMQLGILSNMLRGQPMQAMTTQSYQAQPSYLQQGIGALGAINAMQGNKSSKEGGVIKEMAAGGIASGLNDYELRGMSKRLGDDQLGKKVNDPSTDPDTKDILGGEMARRSQTRKAAGVGMASGGILAFAKGSEEAIDTIDSPFAKEEKDAPVESKFIDATTKKEAKKEEKKAAPKASADVTGQSKEYRQMERDIGTALADRQKISPQEQTLRDALDQETKRTPQSYLEEQQAMLKAAGADPQFFEKARTPLTKRMAELGAGAENKKNIREAQAWATFGSTPGPMLSVALKSYSAYLEQSITDEDDLAKAQAELNKAMFDIDKSEYLEKAGFAKEAVKAKYDGFNRVTDLSYKVATLTENRNKDVLDTREKMVTQANRSQTEKSTAAMRQTGGGGGEDKLKLKENENINKALEAFDKRKEKQVEDLNSKITALPEGHRIRVGAEEGLRKIESERKDLENRLREQMKRGTVSADGAAPKEEKRPAGIPSNAEKADDGHYYAPDPNRPGKYLKYS
jgi:hypothetical protein